MLHELRREGPHPLAAEGEVEDGVRAAAEVEDGDVLVHDVRADVSVPFALSRLSDPTTLATTPIGVFRDVEREVYDDLMTSQISDDGDLGALLRGRDTWTVV